MAKNTSISLGDYFQEFIEAQIQKGRYGSASEVVRASLRLLEEREQKLEALRQALIQGKASGDDVPFDMNEICGEAKREAGLDVKHCHPSACP